MCQRGVSTVGAALTCKNSVYKNLYFHNCPLREENHPDPGHCSSAICHPSMQLEDTDNNTGSILDSLYSSSMNDVSSQLSGENDMSSALWSDINSWTIYLTVFL